MFLTKNFIIKINIKRLRLIIIAGIFTFCLLAMAQSTWAIDNCPQTALNSAFCRDNSQDNSQTAMVVEGTETRPLTRANLDLSHLVPGEDYVRDQVIVKLKPGTEVTSWLKELKIGGKVTVTESTQTLGLSLLALEGISLEKAIAFFSQDANIEYAQPNYQLSVQQIPNDTYFSEQWALHNTGQLGGTPNADIDAPEAWDIQTGDGSVIIAVIDTGVDYHHPDLDDNMWTNPGEAGELADNGIDDDGNGFVDDYYGWNFFDGDNDPDAGLEQGTHVAGIIAAEGNNGIGVTGINWDAQIMPIRIISGGGLSSVFSAIRAIEYAVMMGADIIHGNWGFDDYDEEDVIYKQGLYDAIAAAGEAGVLFIAPAGNNNRDIDATPQYPASYDLDNIITVTGTTEFDKLGGEGSLSNYGATSVDLGAPGGSFYGEKIYSTVPLGFLEPPPEGTYDDKSGTAMAAAHVAGVAALVLAQDPDLTAAEVKQLLLDTSDRLSDLEGKTVSGGRLNAYNALLATQAGKIKGSKWNDEDGDGVWDAGEPALEDWTIYLDSNNNGQLDPGEHSATTDRDGSYSLNLLQPGTYTVAEVLQPGWSQTRPLSAGTYQVEIEAEEVISGLDFGNFLSNPAEIHGRKWHDRDGDGIQDGDEVGLAGWTIYLDQNQNGQLDEGEISTVTDANGDYALTGLAPGIHTLGEVLQAGWESTSPVAVPVAFEYVWSDSNQPGGPTFNWIDISDEENRIDFEGSQEKLVDLPFEFPFYEEKRNFVIISSEGFLTFMTPFRDSFVGGSSTALATLDLASTAYPGQQAPIPHAVPPNDVIAPFWDDDFNLDGGGSVYYYHDAATDQFIVQYQEIGYSSPYYPNTFEVILSPNGSIVYQYYDLDGDVTDATVGIENKYGNEGIQLAYKESYVEDDLAVRFELVPNAFVYHTVELDPDESVDEVNFGNREIPTGEIQGSKWHDVDGNGIWDSGEPGLANWTIYLDDNQNGQLDGGEVSTVTDADGNYVFTDLESGAYTVAEVLPADWQATYPMTFDYEWSDSNQPGGPSFNWIDISGKEGVESISLGDDQYEEVTLPFSFPFYGKEQNSLKIASNGYLTFGGNGIAFSNNEIPNAALPNDLIAAFWDNLEPRDLDSIYYYYDAAAAQFIIQYQGIYTFEVILNADGTILYQYDDLGSSVNESTVGIENSNGTEGIQIAYHESYLEEDLAVRIELVPNPPLSQNVHLDPGETATDIDFGNREIPTGEIHGSKWHDVDGNGIWDNGEVGLADWTIYLDDNQNGQLDGGEISTVTDENGNYAFTGLDPGTYTVAEVLPADWQGTYPTALNYEWSDSNQAGGPSFNWIDISGVGTPISFGYRHYAEVTLPFSFPFYGKEHDRLRISSYGYLTFGPYYSSRYNDPIPDADSPNDLIAPFWDDLDIDDGGSVYYYHDAATDQFIVQYQDIPSYPWDYPNTFEVILNSDGTILYQYYDLDGIVDKATIGIENADGTEGVEIAYNESYVGDDLAVRIELVPYAPLSQSVQLDPAEIVTELNFGNREIPPSEIQGSKWHDLDGNGIWDSGEVGLAGWTVYLDQNENGQLDSSEISTVTDENGNYAFTGLDPGTYTVAEVLKADWQATYPMALNYGWSDSKQAGGPSFNWIDISGVGTPISLGDDQYEEVALPFSFPFYGKEQNSLKIASNGYLTFGGDGTDSTNNEIPNAALPNDLIAPFWDNLEPRDLDSIYYYYDAAADQFIVQYQGIYTFEVILNSDGTIVYQYDDLGSSVNESTVGIENSNGSEGIQIAYNESYFEDNLAIEFELVPNPPLSHTLALDSGETVAEIDFGNYILNQPPEVQELMITVNGTSWSNTLESYGGSQDKP